MIAVMAPVAALLVSVALLLMGNGLQGTLLPVRAHLEHFATPQIGLIGTAYFIGFGMGCYFGGRLVRRAGHIRTFSAMASLASTMALIHALYPVPELWWVLRAISGFCFAVLYVVIESWLNEKATNETRGLILSIYNAINLTVITIGQLMLTLYDPAGFPLFVLASVLVSLAVIPLAMTTALPPAPVELVRLRLKYLYARSPVGCVGALVVGMANGAFWALGPVFAQERGFSISGIALFMSATVLAGAAGQLPLGQLSDRRDRRQIVVLACVLASLSGLSLALITGFGEWTTYAGVVVFGTVAFPLYSVCLAHLNDKVNRDEFVEASSAMLLLYAIGAAAGSIPASMLMSAMGPEGLFLFTATAHGGFAVFAMFRIRQQAAPTAEEKEPFVSVPRTSPTLYAMDPRSEPAPTDVNGDSGGASAQRPSP